MHKIRLTGYQTISILKSVKAGRTVKDICSKAIFRLHVITAGRRNMAGCIGDIQVLTEMAERYPRYGFKKFCKVLHRQGHVWKYKRIHRIYCLLKLMRVSPVLYKPVDV